MLEPNLINCYSSGRAAVAQTLRTILCIQSHNDFKMTTTIATVMRNKAQALLSVVS